jgi:ribose 5-phosphate isomerase B
VIIIAGDHYAVDLVKKIEQYLNKNNQEFKNVGTMDAQKRVALQKIIPAITMPIQSGKANWGILICGTGVGVEIGANRFKGIRASLCIDAKQAEFAKVYDNANVLCLSSWLNNNPDDILQAWFGSKFDENANRAQMIKDFDKWG